MEDIRARGASRSQNPSHHDDELLTLHPRVREAIVQENRDRPLTLNWLPLDPDAYAHLGLAKLSRNATKARDHIITEALVAGPDRYISYSRRWEFYVQRQRYYRETYSYRAIIRAVDQLADSGLLDHEKRPPGSRGFQSRFRASHVLLKELERVEMVYEPLETILLRDRDGYLIDYRDNRDTRGPDVPITNGSLAFSFPFQWNGTEQSITAGATSRVQRAVFRPGVSARGKAGMGSCGRCISLSLRPLER